MKKQKKISQYIDGLIGILILGSILLFITACQSTVILPGLCYNDRDGTHICPKSEEDYKRDMEELEPIYEACEEWESHDGETWMQCIMNEQRRRQLLERVKNTA